MKIHFEPKDFLKALRLVKTAVPKASFVPALRYIKIHANFKDGAILHATDKEYGIRVRLDVDVSEPGCALLPAKELIDTLATIPKEHKAIIEKIDDGIQVIEEHANADWYFVSEESIDQFPDVANFTATAYHEVDDADMLTQG